MEGVHDVNSAHYKLKEWKTKYDKTHQNELASVYLFSPEWTKAWESLWSTYDELNSARLEAQEGLLEWQTRYEEERNLNLRLRASHYQPMRAELEQLNPLSIQLDKYLGAMNQQFLYPWKSMLSNWNRFRELYHSDQDRGPSFRASLSETQHFAFRVLDDWWLARYCNSKLVVIAKNYIHEHQETFDPRCFPTSKRRKVMGLAACLYHSFCMELFLAEFHPQHWSPYTSLVDLAKLQGTRYHATCHALTQRLSYAVLLPLEKSQMQDYPEDYPRALVNENLWLGKTGQEHEPMYLWDAQNRKTILVPDLASCPSYTCISHTWGRWRKQGCQKQVSGVPWEVPENTLYDIMRLPEWLAGLGKPFVWFDLFCIPQDGRREADIEISRQASIFKHSASCVAWIHDCDGWEGTQNALDWLALKYYRYTNLFSDNMAIDARVESALQKATELPPEIFKLHDVAMEFFKQQNGMYDFYRDSSLGQPCNWFSSLWTLQEAVLCPEIRLYSRDWKPLVDRNGFYITLSTLMMFLREACPISMLHRQIDAPFYDPYSFKSAVAEAQHKIFKDSQYVGWPASAVSLHYLMNMTRLDDVLSTLSPMDVFINANIRQCSGDRAPAIMSAIGVTDWFSSNLQEQQKQLQKGQKSKWSALTHQKNSLVLNCFPLDFLQESVKKFGAMFYDVQSNDGARLSAHDVTAGNHTTGSLMPFTKPKGWATSAIGHHVTIQLARNDHESVSGWVIQLDGSVKISRAGITASSHRNSHEVKRMDIIINRHGFDPSVSNHSSSDSSLLGQRNSTRERSILRTDNWNAALQQLMRGEGSTAGDHEKEANPQIYAVCLYQETFHQHGLLLQSPSVRRVPKWVGSKRYLVKIGTYVVNGDEMPVSTNVNWVVL